MKQDANANNIWKAISCVPWTVSDFMDYVSEQNKAQLYLSYKKYKYKIIQFINTSENNCFV